MPTINSQRRFIVFSGEAKWCVEQAQQALAPLNAPQTLWVGARGVTHKQVLQLLGQEHHAVVYDAFSGLHPDTFAAACGTIVAGGAMILLCPDFAHWPSYSDPVKDKLAPYPLSSDAVTGHYIARWCQLLSAAPEAEVVSQQDPKTPAMIHPAPVINQPLDQAYTADQQQAVAAVVKVVTGQRKRPAVLTADRGRGKSAALGIAIAQLAQLRQLKAVAVVGGENHSVDILFKHLRASLGQAQSEQTDLVYKGVSVTKVALEALEADSKKYDLVVVDEAATIGLPRLKRLLQRHSRLAFATTLHGYEGSGRGFELKFTTTLKQHCRGARFVTLQQPIRWSDDDKLERLSQQLLLLSAQLPAIKAAPQPKLKYTLINKANLWQDEQTLNQIVGLLVAAHYRTRPIDLRYLLDAPDSQLYTQTYNGQLSAVAWINLEGGFEAELAEEICLGTRRPQGHLVAQVLAAHLGLAGAAQLNIARIQRIAVHPQLQRNGLGSDFLGHLQGALQDQVDLLASSFGCDDQLLPFWQRQHYHLVRISDTQNAASGLNSALVLRSLTPSGEAQLAQARTLFSQQFIAQLRSSLSALDGPCLQAILVDILAPKTLDDLSAQQLRDLNYFAGGSRPYESTLGALNALCLCLFGDTEPVLEPQQRRLMISKVLQNRSWASLSDTHSNMGKRYAGKQAIVTALRQVVQTLLSAESVRSTK